MFSITVLASNADDNFAIIDDGSIPYASKKTTVAITTDSNDRKATAWKRRRNRVLF